MALLTEKQIQIITLIALNQSTSKDLYDELCEWNEKQPSTQFEPDWSRAPKSAVGASVSVTWVNETGYNTLGYTLANYDRPASVITPHPHVEMMVKYAEVATRRVDPWMEFERYNYLTGSWDRLDDHPSWRPNAIYHYFGE